MKPIPEEEIERIKQSTDLVAKIEQRGVHLKPQGQEYIGHCPFHEDKTPSFRANPAKGVWHCFGCGKKGNVIQFVMEYDKKSFRDALASLNGSPQTQTTKKLSAVRPQVSQPTKLPSDPSSEKATLDVLTYYHQTLKNTPTALAYLQKRGLNHPELIDHFKIGFVNRSLSKKLPPRQSPEGQALRADLKSWGLLRENGQEHFGNCLTFPLFKTDGQLGEIYGRRIGSRHGSPDHLYLPGAHQGVFNHQVLGHDSPLLICESIIDALTLWVHDWRHVTTSFGAGGFTEEMFHLIQERPVKTIWIAYDNDEGGNHQADVLAQRLVTAGLEVERILLPKGADINSFALSQSNPKEVLKELLEQRFSYNAQLQPLPLKSLTPDKPNAPIWDGQQLTITYGERYYRLRGLDRNRNIDTLKIQLKVECQNQIFIDTIDLTIHRQRRQFISDASLELNIEEEVIKRDMTKLVILAESTLEKILTDNLTTETQEGPPVMGATEQQEALDFLKQSDLLEKILKDFSAIGLVGEDTNKLVGYLAAISRKLEDPLAVLVQSSSSAGKTTLMDGILSLVPPEDQEKWTTLTSQALYYVEETQLQHKLIAVAEEEGVEKATYPLKILQSEKELKIATTVKDPKSGEFKVQSKHAEGPCAILLTTTAAEVDEELVNRFIRLTVNEEEAQTKAIHEKQREAKMLQGLENKVKTEAIRRRHHNAQRLLKPVHVLNPYANQLTFFSNSLRSRRDHKKYLGLIETITFLHQYQRPIKQTKVNGEIVEYIEVMIEDIEVANRLMSEVLGRCLDELAPQTRKLLAMVYQMVREQCEEKDLEMNEVAFTRKTIRAYTCWSDNQLKVHLKRLEDLEYLLVKQGGRGQFFVYELYWDGEGQNGERFIPGLVDPKKLKNPKKS